MTILLQVILSAALRGLIFRTRHYYYISLSPNLKL